MSSYKNAIFFLTLSAGALHLPVLAAQSTMDKAEARQMREDTTPQGQYRNSTREANAAYQDAVAECKALRSKERNDCMKEARTNLKNDLAEAKKNLSSGQ